MSGYFAIGNAIEQRLHDEFGDRIKLICSAFTENNPEDLKRAGISLHIAPLPSEFGNFTGNGAVQAETQHWQIALCFTAPKNAQEVKQMREQADVLMLSLRKCLQGYAVDFLGGRTFLRVVSGTRFDMTADCRFRLFSFTVSATVKI